MHPHPLAEKYPLMSGDEYEAFKADIGERGLQNPIWLYEGKILDGRNRYRACGELGVEPFFAEYDGDDPVGFVDCQNLHRRHLTAEFRRERVKELRATGMSTRAIAKELKVSQMTVVRDIESGETSVSPAAAPPEDATCRTTSSPRTSSVPSSRASSPPAPATPVKVTGQDGKKYPATKPPAKPVKQPKPEPKPPPVLAREWAEFFTQLATVQEFSASISKRSIPEEMESWQLVKSLEEAARNLMLAAKSLRNSPR
jgi:hypothetical protein